MKNAYDIATEQTLWGGGLYIITEWTRPCALGIPYPHTRFTLSAAKESSLNVRHW